MTSAVEKHETLIAEGWRTRADGLMRPPADWPDQRPRMAYDEPHAGPMALPRLPTASLTQSETGSN